jgi:hypothetical protein
MGSLQVRERYSKADVQLLENWQPMLDHCLVIYKKVLGEGPIEYAVGRALD